MDDYSDELISSKNNLSGFLYANAKKLLASKNKMDFRQAYDDLSYLDKLNPNYKDVRNLMDEAQFKGTDFVHVYTKNETNMVIPVRLQDDLLDFSTYGINDKWTVYHNNKQKNITYDFDEFEASISINPSITTWLYTFNECFSKWTCICCPSNRRKTVRASL